MKLYYYCSSISCQKENSFQTKATNRIELKEERGSMISERCKHCGTIVKKRVNRVHAKANYLWIVAGLLISIIATFILWHLGWIAGLTFTIPILVWKAAEKQASDFNKVMVSDN